MIYEFIQYFNDKQIFINVCLLIIFVYYMMDKSIGLNIILGLILATIVIIYLYERSKHNISVEQEEYNVEKSMIIPAVHINDKDLLDFI